MLMLISIICSSRQPHKGISIHLMLMLIRDKRFYRLLCIHFNTSHVNVNLWRHSCRNECRDISIHLMLMLIRENQSIHTKYLDFNTSHVNVNPLKSSYQNFHRKYFNTSHVNVNQNYDPMARQAQVFQYISC